MQFPGWLYRSLTEGRLVAGEQEADAAHAEGFVTLDEVLVAPAQPEPAPAAAAAIVEEPAGEQEAEEVELPEIVGE